jgi:hypothetical protein
MFFVPVMWAGYEVACMTPSGRAAIGVTHDKIGRLFGRAGTEWRILCEWPTARLSHTDVMTYLGEQPEPDAPEGIVTLIAALLQSGTRPVGS